MVVLMWQSFENSTMFKSATFLYKVQTPQNTTYRYLYQTVTLWTEDLCNLLMFPKMNHLCMIITGLRHLREIIVFISHVIIMRRNLTAIVVILNYGILHKTPFEQRR